MKLRIIFLALALASCNYNHVKTAASTPEVSQEKAENPDFETVMSAVIRPKCLGCHAKATGDRGSSNLESYGSVRAQLARVYYRTVESKDMPPARPLSDKLATILKRWIETGAPEKVIGGGQKPVDNIEAGPTNWTKIRDKIFKTKCLDCHQPPDAMGGVDLSDLNLVRGLAPRIFDSVVVKASMPLSPYPAVTPVERRVLLKWFDLGMPK